LAPGRAVRTGLYVTRGVKRCPDCGKGGLQYRKALLAGLKRTDPFDPKNDRSKLAVDSGDITAGSYSRDFGWSMYCPRCKKWVYPVRREAPSAPA
jgi:ssDNA-binding Zn-finger/Zn-ribbon topoisomerase 1